MLLCIVVKNEEWIARNNMVHVGKSWIECYYYKWYSVRFLFYVFLRASLRGRRRTLLITS